MSAAEVHVLGVRHHGPGSARSVRRALDHLQPQVVLVEGPADADHLLPLLADPDLVPPVALMAYAPEDPGAVTFWPFAVFSPEWQAISWAVEHDVPVRFCDLPAGVVLGLRAAAAEAADGSEDESGGDAESDDDEQGDDDESSEDDDAVDPAVAGRAVVRRDPIALLAEAGGHDDPERWWEDVVEHRVGNGPSAQDGADDGLVAGFAALTEAMAAVRDHLGEEPDPAERAREAAREAQMRQVLRTATKEAERVVVVCGAWHAPALTGKLPTAVADRAALRGADGKALPKRKVEITWVPWTHSRLATTSGYGAGITSPGWYHHLFTAPDRVVTRWMTRVAALLREHDLPVSSAHVIEAVRLAEALAALRRRPLAGLAEVVEATRAVLCEGEEAATRLVLDGLVVGEALGAVPADVPTVPLTADLRATARRLKLKQEASERTLDLDLRKPLDAGRSRLLHRLGLLGIGWGAAASSAVRSTGTFRETWRLRWDPALEVTLVENARWGATVGMAATARVVDDAETAGLGRLGELVDACLLADLPETFAHVLGRLDRQAAASTDVVQLMAALPPLVRTLRYGDVRGTDTRSLTGVVEALLARVCAGLPAAVGSLDEDAAQQLRERIEAVHAAVALHDQPEATRAWLDTVQGLVDRHDVAAVLVGRAVRLLRDVGRIEPPEAAERLSRALSRGATPQDRAGWVDGFLAGGGALLVHDRELLALLDAWVCDLAEQDFVDTLPLVRRTFGTFESGERRQVADRVRERPRRETPAGPRGAGWDVDDELGRPALLAVARLLGVAP